MKNAMLNVKFVLRVLPGCNKYIKYWNAICYAYMLHVCINSLGKFIGKEKEYLVANSCSKFKHFRRKFASVRREKYREKEGD